MADATAMFLIVLSLLAVLTHKSSHSVLVSDYFFLLFELRNMLSQVKILL
jgi:hypothetical protein